MLVLSVRLVVSTTSVSGHAAIVEREILGAVERAVAVGAAIARHAPPFRLERERGQAAVGRIGDERRLTKASCADIESERADRVRVVAPVLLVRLRTRDEFLVRQVEPIAVGGRTLQRHTDHVVGRPRSLNVRVAPWRLWRCVSLPRRSGRRPRRRDAVVWPATVGIEMRSAPSIDAVTTDVSIRLIMACVLSDDTD
jgi:hypothetical protein